MDRLRHIFLLPSAIVLVWSLPAVAQSDAGDQEISNEVVKKAIDKGMHRLLEAQNADGSWEPYMSRFEVGPSAIAAYALLEGGAARRTPRSSSPWNGWPATTQTSHTNWACGATSGCSPTRRPRSTGRISRRTCRP